MFVPAAALMFKAISSNSCEEASALNSSATRFQDSPSLNLNPMASSTIRIKKKRNLPGHPDPDAEVIALSPRSLLATNRYVCEICNKGFQREQNLQLHKRGHNLPWKLKQRNSSSSKESNNGKRAYVCPEPTCVHHHPSRALGDLTGIKKHFSRKHGEKKWKCEKCCKTYAVQSDCKAHAKACGTRKYTCRCGTLFFRKDSFVTHKAFCEALAEESARLSSSSANQKQPSSSFHLHPSPLFQLPPALPNPNPLLIKPEISLSPQFLQPAAEHGGRATLSATALLQKAATVGAQAVGQVGSSMAMASGLSAGMSPEYYRVGLTRDFLGLTMKREGNDGINGGVDVNARGRKLLPFTVTGGLDVELDYPYDHDHTIFTPQSFGFAAQGYYR